jgi:hypothetical protein
MGCSGRLPPPMAKWYTDRQPDWRATVWAGVIAGILATLIQVLLWLAFTDDFPGILFRDARLTAALVTGSSAASSQSATFDAGIMLVATVVHFALSIAYAALLVPFTVRLGNLSALLAGAAFGITLYFLNLYGLTVIFPWFVQARSWIAAIAHVVFGVTIISVYRCLDIRNVQSRSDRH